MAALATVGLGYWTGFRPSSQVFGDFPCRGQTDEPLVALTFDDGPNEPYTTQLLDVLDRRQVKATFFQVGCCAERFPASTRNVAAAGHVLGNHSYSHRFGGYLSNPTQRSEIERCQDVLTRIAGVAPAFYRPPWLCHWPWVLRTIRESGLQVVSGEFGHPLEVCQPAAATMVRTAAALSRPGSVLIFHDGAEARGGRRDQTVAAIGPLIDILRERGYRFVTIEEMLGPAPTAC